jgi:HTH-type transcriptional repressor of NAD biosynthesis genes
MMLSGVASFTGVMSVVLTTKGKFSSYFWGIINCILYGLFAFAYGYTGDAQLNIIFFLPFQFIGIYMWKDNLDNEETAIPRSLNFWKWLLVLISSLLLSVGFYYEIPPFTILLTGSYAFTDNQIPWKLDAVSNALNVVAQILLIGRYWEQWILWIAVDCMQIAMYTGVARFGIEINIITMWCLFLVNALFGCKIWFLKWYRNTEVILFYRNFFNLNQSPEEIIGLIIGKFYPFHKGHQFLADTATKNSDKLFIIICEKDGERPSGELREKWIKEIYPDAIVKRILDVYDPNNSQLWANVSINAIECKPDIVFTSEKYGVEFARYLGCKHVMVDEPRGSIPISGSLIRANPLFHLNYLHPIVRSYYIKRVVLIGAESTGKTTLSIELAKHYKTTWVPEYGREITERKYNKENNISLINNINDETIKKLNSLWKSEDFIEIADKQCKNENKAARLANKILVCDTNAFATMIWHYRYMKFYSEKVKEIYLNHKPADLYLLLDPDIPFVQDGLRDGEDYRYKMHKLFIDMLNERNLPYSIIKGNYEERKNSSISAINKAFHLEC